jgi:hypothetical protein
MQERSFILSYHVRQCRIHGRPGTVKTVTVEEVLKNGKKQTVHTDIHYETTAQEVDYRNLLRLFKNPLSEQKGRRAA